MHLYIYTVYIYTSLSLSLSLSLHLCMSHSLHSRYFNLINDCIASHMVYFGTCCHSDTEVPSMQMPLPQDAQVHNKDLPSKCWLKVMWKYDVWQSSLDLQWHKWREIWPEEQNILKTSQNIRCAAPAAVYPDYSRERQAQQGTFHNFMFAKDVKNIEKQMSWETLIKKQVLTRLFGSMFVGNCGNVVRLIAPHHFWTAFSSHSPLTFRFHSAPRRATQLLVSEALWHWV